MEVGEIFKSGVSRGSLSVENRLVRVVYMYIVINCAR